MSQKDVGEGVEAYGCELTQCGLGKPPEGLELVLSFVPRGKDRPPINISFRMKDAIRIRDFVNAAIAKFPEIIEKERRNGHEEE